MLDFDFGRESSFGINKVNFQTVMDMEIKKRSQLLKEREAKRLARRTAKRKTYQDGYRQRKTQSGLVRYELEVPATIKAQLDEMADLLSDEMDEGLSYRQRVAQARRQLFVDGVERNVQAFCVLQERIDALEDEVAQLSPSLLASVKPETSALPEAIQRLPDEGKPLKHLLAQFYKRAISAERKLKETDERANRFLELYEVQSEENKRLGKQVKSMGGYDNTLVTDDGEEGAFG